MVQLIVAMDKNGGIGKNGRLPWRIPEELKIFKRKTLDKQVIFGRITLETLPRLQERQIACLSSKSSEYINRTTWKNEPKFFYNNIWDIITKNDNPDDIFIAGGEKVYNSALLLKQPRSDEPFIHRIHISIVKGVYDCDTFIDVKHLHNYTVIEKVEYDKFTHYVMDYGRSDEYQYLELLENVMNTGTMRTCRNGPVLSTFHHNLTFDLRNGFPLLTTKKMFLRGVIEELLFFLRGDTDSKILESKGVNIWKGNTSREFLDSLDMKDRREGVMGPLYGYQWRFFNVEYDEDKSGPRNNGSNTGIDQLKNIVEIIKTDPNSRRILLTTYNPSQLSECVLPPCHSIVLQFYVINDFLDLSAYSRSADVFLGVPFNIASYALLLMIIAKLTRKVPRMLYITLGDTHIYQEHISLAKEQQRRIPCKFPSLKVPDINSLDDINNLSANDFIILGYMHYSVLKATMVA